MKIAVWRTAHDIANGVARSVWDGFNHLGIEAYMVHTLAAAPEYPDLQREYIDKCDVHIAYGILRGTADVFRKCSRLNKPWFNVDRGYWKPSHFDGYYRVSYRGTQATSNWIAPDYERLDKLKLDIKPWRGFDESKPVLLIPPTEHVRQFFELYSFPIAIGDRAVVREKGDPTPINFNDYNYVHTFNSSVGWQALAAGIPCVSDTTHSMIGSWFNNISLDQLADKQLQERHRLFATMAASQFTLQEIEQGKLWPYLKHCLSSLVLMEEKQSLQKSPPTASSAGLKAHFQSTT